jgi:uncharacterized protein (TIGR02145 family)
MDLINHRNKYIQMIRFRKSATLLIFIGSMALIIAGCKKSSGNITTSGGEVGTVSDFEGNVYPTKKFGNQWWMTDNLKSTYYSNGDPIGTTIPYNVTIASDTLPKYEWSFIGNEGVAYIYGRLYTWYAVTDSRNICPTGWHPSTNEEWTNLINFIISKGYGNGGSGENIGKAMASTSGWLNYGVVGVPGNDQLSNNSSGFSSFAAGVRTPPGAFNYCGGDAYYWTSSQTDIYSADYIKIIFDVPSVYVGNLDKKMAMAVRCVKN